MEDPSNSEGVGRVPIKELEVTHCVFCGEKGSPLMAFGDTVLFECDRHGEFEVEVCEPTHQ